MRKYYWKHTLLTTLNKVTVSTLWCILLFLIHYPTLEAQKYDYIWVRGTGGSQPTPKEYKTSFMDFSTKPPTITIGKKNPPLLGCIACISDSLGKLLFFTNLIQVFNAKEDIMINGSQINYGKVWLEYQDYGYPGISCAKIIPINDDSLFLMVYGKMNSDSTYLINSPIQYAIIDPYFQNNTGKIILKDVPFHHLNTLNYDFVRHGNGKDWWLILCEWNVNEQEQRYYRYLVNQKGQLDSIGMQSFPVPSYVDGFPRFNQIGNSYVKYSVGFNGINSLTIFDFDRCSGQLQLKKDYQYTKIWNTYSFEFSPNGRYLYPNKLNVLLQVDLHSNDSNLFIDTLANIDGYSEPVVGTSFGFTQLTPNNEIMVFPIVPNPKAINVIHQPDLPGLASDFEQHSIIGPVYAKEGPQFPNYRLKELYGSPCDTIGFVNTNSDWVLDTTAKQLCLIPTIPKSFTKLALRIYDQTGDNILEEQFTSPQTSYCLKTDSLLPGKYIWYMWIDDKKILKGSILIP